MDGERSRTEMLGLFGCESTAKGGIVTHLHENGFRNLTFERGRLLLFGSEKRIEEFTLTGVLAELAMLEEDVHGFPECVVEDFNQFLMDERVLERGLQRVRPA